jgi:F-type H+-transporting ATPase subunit b
MAFLHDPAFWVAIAFIGFIGVALYFKLPGMLAKTLDERAAKIKHELEEAQRLREEAQALFAEYQRKTRGAEKEAEEILAFAKEESKRQAAQAKQDLEDLMTRRAAMAEAKIAQAEAQAVQDVRNAAVDVAVAAAERLLAQEMAGDKADALLDQSISELKTKLH